MTGLPDLELLIPHAPPMRLIDRVLSSQGDVTRAEATITANHAFNVPGRGVPAYVGFELMAQTISAHDGVARWRSGRRPAIGLLMGCRRYVTALSWFAVGDRLEIEVRSLLDGGETGSFDCTVLHRDVVAASGVVSVYRPTDSAVAKVNAHD